jgi:hypothetical protein
VGRELQVELLQKTELNAVKIWKQEKKTVLGCFITTVFWENVYVFNLFISKLRFYIGFSAFATFPAYC